MDAAKPRKQPIQGRSRAIVEAMLDATARILTRGGYAQVNTNAVAAEAGVSVGSLYQYFPNKDALVTAVVERHGQRIHAAITDAAGTAPPASLREAVERIVAAVAAAHRIDPALHGVLESEMPHVPVPDGHGETVRAIHELLARLPPDVAAEMRVADLTLAARVVGEIVHAIVHAALIPQDAAGLGADAMEREAVRAVIAYLAG